MKGMKTMLKGMKTMVKGMTTIAKILGTKVKGTKTMTGIHHLYLTLAEYMIVRQKAATN